MNYIEWNRLVSDWFFKDDSNGRPVLLQVDPEELATMAGLELPEDARLDFEAAVKQLVGVDGSLSDFEYRSHFEIWDRVGQKRFVEPPPFVALLGASVLAAYDMSSDQARGVSASNYYVRLKNVIGVDLTLTGRGRLSQYWERLNTWLDQDKRGTRGRSTAFPFQGFANIGYPLSQCTLRRADRQKLPDFFRWCRLGPKQLFDTEQLLLDFQDWLKLRRCSFTPRTTELLGLLVEGGHGQLVADDLAYEYELWDGSYREAGGARSALIELQCRVTRPHRRVSLQFVPRRPEGFPSGLFQASGETAGVEVREGDSGFYEPLPLPATSHRLAGGFQLRNGPYRLTFTARDIFVLEQNSDLGDWVTCDQVSLAEPTLVLCRGEFTNAVEATLSAHADAGWHQFSGGESGLPSGWYGFCCVRFSNSITGTGLDMLEPRRGFELHLEGGLKFATDCWFQHGLPRVVISSDTLPEAAVTLDGRAVATVALPARLDLDDYDLDVGDHELCVSGRTVRFRVAETAPPDARSRRLDLGWPFDKALKSITVPAAESLDPAKPGLMGARFTELGLQALGDRYVAVVPGTVELAWLGVLPGQVHRIRSRPLLSQTGESVIDDLGKPTEFDAAWLWWRENGTAEFVAPASAFHSSVSPPVPPAANEKAFEWALMLVSSHIAAPFCSPGCHDACLKGLRAHRLAARPLLEVQ